MPAIRISTLPGLTLMLLLGLTCPAAGSDQEDEAALRRQALELNRVTGEGPIAATIRDLGGKPADTKKMLAIARRMAQEKKQPFNYNAAYILGRVAPGLNDLDSSLVFLRVAADHARRLQSVSKIAQSCDPLIPVLYFSRLYEECVKTCREVLELPDDEQRPRGPVEKAKQKAIVYLVRSLARLDKADEAIKTIEKVFRDPDSWPILELRGEVLYLAGKNEEAAKTYEKVLGLVLKDKALSQEEKEKVEENYRAMLSHIYIDLKQVDKAAEQLQVLLKRQPDHPTYNNDLGYVWADHDMNLAEAEKLIRKAIKEDRKQRKAGGKLSPEEDQDNAAYIDSLGWVLYKQKKYDEAKKYLLEAVKQKEGQHIEILDHLADVHMALKEKAAAVAVWKKALELPATTSREKQRRAEVEKKLKGQK